MQYYDITLLFTKIGLTISLLSLYPDQDYGFVCICFLRFLKYLDSFIFNESISNQVSFENYEFVYNLSGYRGVEVSDCGNYVIYAIYEGCDPVNRLYYVNLKELPNGIDGMFI